MTTVLLVEDEADQRASLVELLEGAGYLVIGAENGDVAIKALQKGGAPDLIIADLGMPTVDGAMFFRICDSMPEVADVPRIIVSGQSNAESLVEICRARALVKKPVDTTALLEVVADTLKRARKK